MKKVSIIGAGAWGTALALSCFRAGAQVKVWSISLDEVETINNRHENVYRLPGIPLDPSIQATTLPEDVVQTDVALFVIPAQVVRSVCETFKPLLPPHVPLIIASKGIEEKSSRLMTEVTREYFPESPLLVLSGPSFASDVAKKMPTAVSLAAEKLSISQNYAGLLSSPSFRLYASDDIIGTQIGGACKNIIAIACGILEGLEMGDNARAALVTRGLAEITRLGVAMGAKVETFLGLSGVGDITLTSLSTQSRNMSFGLALGKGTPLDELLSNKKMLTEGVYTVSAATVLAHKYGVDMPLTFALKELLYGGGDIQSLVDSILSRPLKAEAA